MDRKAIDTYTPCKDIKRMKLNIVVTEDVVKEIGSNYRTIPTFEKHLFEHNYKKYYSLQQNELLKCRWQQYKEHIEKKVFTPFQFPCIRDLHFHNGCIRFLPSESIYKYPEYKMKLKPGPGVDFRGQIPIPQELLMKRGKINDNAIKTKINNTKITTVK